MTEAYICDTLRTPIGRYGGALRDVRPDDMLAHPMSTLASRRPDVDWETLDEVVIGCANQAGEDNRNVARMALLLAGLPLGVPGTTMNRLCGSGLDAVGTAARMIKAGEADLVLAGGVESMSRAPFVLEKAGTAFARTQTLQDTTIGWRFVNPRMTSAFGVDAMPETAETVAERFGISRDDQDRFALRSQRRTRDAVASGYHASEIVAVPVPGRKGQIMVDADEHPRPDTSLETLAKLPTPFRVGGTVTAGNASGVNDGAALLVLASAAGVKRHNLVPRARFVAIVTVGVEPAIMGIGPISATKKLLLRTGLKIEDVDLLELNEAFASQALAVLRTLGLPDDAPNVNPHGGAIALGHPLGMSGARLVQTCMGGLEALHLKRAVATMCIGVGQGIASLIERV